MFSGCTDTNCNNTFWCPKPGTLKGVDRVFNPDKIHRCTKKEIGKLRNAHWNCESLRYGCTDEDLCNDPKRKNDLGGQYCAIIQGKKSD